MLIVIDFVIGIQIYFQRWFDGIYSKRDERESNENWLLNECMTEWMNELIDKNSSSKLK